MYLTLTEDDISKFSPSTRAELMAAAFPKAHVALADFPSGFDAEDVVDLTPGQVEEFMQGCADETIAGLKIIADHGPVIHASLLNMAGIENFSHFQGRITKRTRTITKNKGAFLFAWDDWEAATNGIGHYAVSPATFRSLRIYFGLD